MRFRSTKRIGAAAVAAAALVGTIAMGTAAAVPGHHQATDPNPTYKPVAGRVTVVEPGQPQPHVTLHPVYKRGAAVPMHVAHWKTTYDDGVSWNADVFVDYGQSGAYTKCSDGSVHYGPAVGQGYWAWGGNCNGYGTITEFGNYDQ
ncbi:hypothetical protein [Streptomyces silvisoli]|uniref:Secreted protein n=1 Tax=Streptomyces silvisoli TaxID=3034235 RepID=A0ABT5ZIU7_9ACTN|nr:hypothetical protein [Streptomyces silvisoli]MDF3289755.1 hypothetical protein [Streptomyces silvisoli]